MESQRRTPEHWRRIVEGWPASGLTQAQYCERHGISVASLHRWSKKGSGLAIKHAACREPATGCLLLRTCSTTWPSGRLGPTPPVAGKSG
jgi:hypothetical protein